MAVKATAEFDVSLNLNCSLLMSNLAVRDVMYAVTHSYKKYYHFTCNVRANTCKIFQQYQNCR